MASIATSAEATSASSWRAYAQLGESYFTGMIGVELALVMLAAPAAAAGAICVDRARGTLAHMLMTDLSDSEIVLGKLGARLMPVFGLVACTWPVMAIASLLGGIDPLALTLAFAIILTVAVFACALALALSVWARKSHEVTLATYTVFIIGIMVWPAWMLFSSVGWTGPPPQIALLPNPFYMAFAPYAQPGKLGFGDYMIFFGTALGASAALTSLAVWRTRSVACRGTAEKKSGARVGWIGRATRLLPGPSLDRNPVLWHEWHRGRPSLWMILILTLLMGSSGVLCVIGAVAFWYHGVDLAPGSYWEIAGVFAFVLHICFGLLMLAATAPTSMAEERQRGSLDILATTTLSTTEIVLGKWLGTFRLVFLMTIGPGLITLAMATAQSTAGGAAGMPIEYYKILTPGARIFGAVMITATILAHGALITSLGVAMATWFKKQSRAIAATIGAFVLIIAAWPMLFSVLVSPEVGRSLATLSPLVISAVSVNMLTQRRFNVMNGALVSGTFWAVEVFVVAMALLWLTIRTFDRCFDRISDRPSQRSFLSGLIVIVAALLGGGCLVWAVDNWIEGVSPHDLSALESTSIASFSLLISIGLVLVGVEQARSAKSYWTNRRKRNNTLVATHANYFRLWRVIALIALVGCGPALVAISLSTSKRPTRYNPQFAVDARKSQIITGYTRDDSDVPYAGEVKIDERLRVAAMLVVTILVHGGLAISIGRAAGLIEQLSKRTLAMGIAVIVASVLIISFSITIISGGAAPDSVNWSFVSASSALLSILVSRTSFSARATILSVAQWDLALLAAGAGIWYWTTREWQRKLAQTSVLKSRFASELAAYATTAEPAVTA
jgi:ABC-type transport system involved in multi-copper enzyme maturation permease subunit